MRFNKDIEYALISLVAMGREDGLLSARELSDRFSIPYELLCKILQRLSHARIVSSIQGPKGGYRLARDTAEVTLGEILASLQGEKHVAACLDENRSCVQMHSCNIKDSMAQVQSMWDKMINEMSLADFAETLTDKRVPVG